MKQVGQDLRPKADSAAKYFVQGQKPARNELLKRLLANRCELCQSTNQVEVHHIRKLADLKKPGQAIKPLWVRVMAARRRKTLIVCHECHQAIHAGKPTRKPAG